MQRIRVVYQASLGGRILKDERDSLGRAKGKEDWVEVTAEKKSIPPNHLPDIIPPDTSYTYFEGHEDNPFVYDPPGAFKIVNAWWLAEAAFLAYADSSFAKPCFLNAGFSDVEFFPKNNEDALNKSTQCYVAHNDNFIIVAFRGSESKERPGTNGRDIRYIIADWQVDLRANLVESGQGGLVHEGFKEALDEVWDSSDPAQENMYLKPYLDSISNKNGRQLPVWFTGHSLGAALATLAAKRYGDAATLYTFGSPRVGDGAYAEGFHLDSYRFVNNDDLVTKLPFPFPYRHVGRMKYIDSDGNVLDAPSLWRRLTNNFLRVVKNASNIVLLRLRGGVLPENSLSDHAPIYYAIRIWNVYSECR